MKFLINFLLGVAFGFGLISSGIFDPKIAASFFQLGSDWNYSIFFAMMGMFLTSTIYIFLTKRLRSGTKTALLYGKKETLSLHKILGAVLFGIGWGLSGLCVSAATLNLAFSEWENLLFFIFMVLGFYGQSFFKKITL